MDPVSAARATRAYFRNLPRIVHTVCADWASKTSNVLRRTPKLPSEVRRTIHGRAVRTNGQSYAQITCEAQLGLWIERGTGIYGPYKRMIVPKGGSYVDPTNPSYRNRRMLRWKGTVWTAQGVRGKWMATGHGGGGQYAELFGGASYRATQGYIYARAVKGSPARPWFVPGVEKRIPLFRRCLVANMARAAEDITLGGIAARGIIPSG